jgi:hypothetical protein
VILLIRDIDFRVGGRVSLDKTQEILAVRRLELALGQVPDGQRWDLAVYLLVTVIDRGLNPLAELIVQFVGGEVGLAVGKNRALHLAAVEFAQDVEGDISDAEIIDWQVKIESLNHLIISAFQP